ncbi:MAG TPA: hypothetical protein PLB91_05845 [Spirochaetales bacterium]|nr:hypothetical protein [Spirochaetales bacterium]HRY55472.1 hypothetical protein [Spirochaetia bacterium]HRZ63788.1 hypothetical protein [Spirochaetia bacterium]
MPVQRRLVITLSLAAIAAASAVVFAFAALRPFTLVAYRLGEGELAALREACAAYSSTGGKPPRIISARRASSLASLLRGPWKPDLLAFAPGAESAALAARFEPPRASLAGLVPRPLLEALSAGGRAYALPLALDPLELAFNRPAFAAAALEPPRDAASLEAACAALARLAPGPLLVAGADDPTLVALVGQLLAERGGGEAYAALAALLARSKDPLDALEAGLPARGGGTTSLAAALDELASWERSGWLPPAWLSYGRETSLRYLKAGRPALLACFLSQRRAVDYATVSDYGSSLLVLGEGSPSPPLSARILAAAGPAKPRRAAEAERLLGFLLSERGQGILARSMGAAPASSAVPAPDSIAHDSRARAGSAGLILGGLAADSGKDPALLASRFRAYLLEAGRK